MQRLKALDQMRKFITNPAVAGTLTALAVGTFKSNRVVFAAKPPPPPPPPTDCDPNKPLIRPKDLPIYIDPEEAKKDAKTDPNKENSEYPENTLMSLVRWVRIELWNARKEVDNIKKKAGEVVETGQSHADSALSQLRESDDPKPRYGIIGAGAIIGLLFGLRGGIFKKLFYTSGGAAAGAYLCYPDDTMAYSAQVKEMLEEYRSIVYHFTNAAVKDLTGAEITIPDFRILNPADTVKDLYDKATETVKKSLTSSGKTSDVIVQGSSNQAAPDSVPLPPLENPTKSGSSKVIKDQSNPADKDMYSSRA